MSEDEVLGGITDSMNESEQAPGVGEGQGSLACCSPWAAKSWTRLSERTTATRRITGGG